MLLSGCFLDSHEHVSVKIKPSGSSNKALSTEMEEVLDVGAITRYRKVFGSRIDAEEQPMTLQSPEDSTGRLVVRFINHNVK